jgi:hypothetical protein
MDRNGEDTHSGRGGNGPGPVVVPALRLAGEEADESDDTEAHIVRGID